jgi:hypothetical protein
MGNRRYGADPKSILEPRFPLPGLDSESCRPIPNVIWLFPFALTFDDITYAMGKYQQKRPRRGKFRRTWYTHFSEFPAFPLLSPASAAF